MKIQGTEEDVERKENGKQLKLKDVKSQQNNHTRPSKKDIFQTIIHAIYAHLPVLKTCYSANRPTYYIHSLLKLSSMKDKCLFNISLYTGYKI